MTRDLVINAHELVLASEERASHSFVCCSSAHDTRRDAPAKARQEGKAFVAKSKGPSKLFFFVKEAQEAS